MAIEVLLRRSIEGVGRVGEVVRVKSGYARNYLLPRRFAALVTPDAMKGIEKDKAAEVVREAEEAKARAALAERLAAVTLRIEARAGEDGHLYGSVGVRQVLDALKRLKFVFEERHVRFEAVRELGEYEVPILLARDHTVGVKLWVVQDAEEAAAQAEDRARAGTPAPDTAPAAAEPPPAAPSASAEEAPAKPAKASRARKGS
jgi:large subunit ribosomal protein L9